MELQKFYQIKTDDVVYVVTGAEKKADAFKFVSRYKKLKFATMLLSYKIVSAKIVDSDLYIGSAEALAELDGIDCYAITRKSVKL